MSAVSVLLAPDDEAFGARIAGALARRGLSARLIAGDQADLFVDGRLGVDASIVVWSQAAMRLVALHQRARAALEHGALIPVAIDGATAPAGFESLPPVDLSEWRGDDENPRWRFVLEALAIASEYGRDDAPGLSPAPAPIPAPTPTPTPVHEAEITQGGPAEEITALPAVIEKPAVVEPPCVSTPFLASDTVDGRLPRLAPARRANGRQSSAGHISERRCQNSDGPPPQKRQRFDVGAVAVAGVMTLCLATGAAIILGPSFLRPQAPAAPPTSQAPDPSPVPDARGVELAMASPTIAPPVSHNDVVLYEPDELEEFGQGDISYPADDAVLADAPRTTDSHADEIHLAMLGPIGPRDDTAPAIDDRIAPDAAPKAPTLKPLRPRRSGARAGIDTLLATAAGLEATAVAGEPFKDCTICPDMIALSAGDFTMGPVEGARSRPNEGPSTPIALSQPFAIAAREVTFAEWDACVADGGCAGHKAHDFGWGRGDQPVVGVSFADAQNYAAWLSAKTGKAYRLPSEAEWEYAARGGRTSPFSFGEELTSRNANFDGRFAYRGKKSRWVGHPTPASRYPANAFGLFDMHGNVWEWTADCWRTSLTGAPADGSPRGGTCVSRTLKGGAFNTGGWRLRAAHRIGKPASTREMEIGFRVVRALD